MKMFNIFLGEENGFISFPMEYSKLNPVALLEFELTHSDAVTQYGKQFATETL